MPSRSKRGASKRNEESRQSDAAKGGPSILSADDVPKLTHRPVAAFLRNLYSLVDDTSCNDIVHWGLGGQSFVIEDRKPFAATVLPRFYSHRQFSSFTRQLNFYCFERVGDPKAKTGRYEYAHPSFLQGKPDLLCLVVRKTNQTGKKRLQKAASTKRPRAADAAEALSGTAQRESGTAGAARAPPAASSSSASSGAVDSLGPAGVLQAAAARISQQTTAPPPLQHPSMQLPRRHPPKGAHLRVLPQAQQQATGGKGAPGWPSAGGAGAGGGGSSPALMQARLVPGLQGTSARGPGGEAVDPSAAGAPSLAHRSSITAPGPAAPGPRGFQQQHPYHPSLQQHASVPMQAEQENFRRMQQQLEMQHQRNMRELQQQYLAAQGVAVASSSGSTAMPGSAGVGLWGGQTDPRQSHRGGYVGHGAMVDVPPMQAQLPAGMSQDQGPFEPSQGMVSRSGLSGSSGAGGYSSSSSSGAGGRKPMTGSSLSSSLGNMPWHGGGTGAGSIGLAGVPGGGGGGYPGSRAQQPMYTHSPPLGSSSGPQAPRGSAMSVSSLDPYNVTAGSLGGTGGSMAGSTDGIGMGASGMLPGPVGTGRGSSSASAISRSGSQLEPGLDENASLPSVMPMPTPTVQRGVGGRAQHAHRHPPRPHAATLSPPDRGAVHQQPNDGDDRTVASEVLLSMGKKEVAGEDSGYLQSSLSRVPATSLAPATSSGGYRASTPVHATPAQQSSAQAGSSNGQMHAGTFSGRHRMPPNRPHHQQQHPGHPEMGVFRRGTAAMHQEIPDLAVSVDSFGEHRSTTRKPQQESSRLEASSQVTPQFVTEGGIPDYVSAGDGSAMEDQRSALEAPKPAGAQLPPSHDPAAATLHVGSDASVPSTPTPQAAAAAAPQVSPSQAAPAVPPTLQTMLMAAAQQQAAQMDPNASSTATTMPLSIKLDYNGSMVSLPIDIQLRLTMNDGKLQAVVDGGASSRTINVDDLRTCSPPEGKQGAEGSSRSGESASQVPGSVATGESAHRAASSSVKAGSVGDVQQAAMETEHGKMPGAGGSEVPRAQAGSSSKGSRSQPSDQQSAEAVKVPSDGPMSGTRVARSDGNGSVGHGTGSARNSEGVKSVAAVSEAETTESGSGSAPPVVVGVEARGEIPSPAPAPPPAVLPIAPRNPEAAQKTISGALGLLESTGIGGATELRDKMQAAKGQGQTAGIATEDMATEAKRQVAAAAVAVRQAAVEVVKAVGAHPAETLNRAVAELDAMNQAINSAGPDILPDMDTSEQTVASVSSSAGRSQAVQDFVQARARDMAASRVSAALAGAPGAVEGLCNSATVDATQAILAAQSGMGSGAPESSSEPQDDERYVGGVDDETGEGVDLPRQLTGSSDQAHRMPSAGTDSSVGMDGGGETPTVRGSALESASSSGGGGGVNSTQGSGSRRATDGSTEQGSRNGGRHLASRGGAEAGDAQQQELSQEGLNDLEKDGAGLGSVKSSTSGGTGSKSDGARSRANSAGRRSARGSRGSARGSTRGSRGGRSGTRSRGSASGGKSDPSRWTEHGGATVSGRGADGGSQISAADSQSMDAAAAQSAAVAAGQAALAAARAISHATAAIRRMEEDAIAARKDTELMDKAMGALVAQNDKLKEQVEEQNESDAPSGGASAVPAVPGAKRTRRQAAAAGSVPLTTAGAPPSKAARTGSSAVAQAGSSGRLAAATVPTVPGGSFPGGSTPIAALTPTVGGVGPVDQSPRVAAVGAAWPSYVGGAGSAAGGASVVSQQPWLTAAPAVAGGVAAQAAAGPSVVVQPVSAGQGAAVASAVRALDPFGGRSPTARMGAPSAAVVAGLQAPASSRGLADDMQSLVSQSASATGATGVAGAAGAGAPRVIAVGRVPVGVPAGIGIPLEAPSEHSGEPLSPAVGAPGINQLLPVGVGDDRFSSLSQGRRGGSPAGGRGSAGVSPPQEGKGESSSAFLQPSAVGALGGVAGGLGDGTGEGGSVAPSAVGRPAVGQGAKAGAASIKGSELDGLGS